MAELQNGAGRLVAGAVIAALVAAFVIKRLVSKNRRRMSPQSGAMEDALSPADEEFFWRASQQFLDQAVAHALFVLTAKQNTERAVRERLLSKHGRVMARPTIEVAAALDARAFSQLGELLDSAAHRFEVSLPQRTISGLEDALYARAEQRATALLAAEESNVAES